MSDTGARFTDVEVENKRLPACIGYIEWKLLPIEEAVQDLNILVPAISRFVKESKKRCTYPNDNNLSKDESAAVYLYTMEMSDKACVYRILNETLRADDRRKVRPWFAYLKLLDSGLSKLPHFRGTVWRGIPKDVTAAFKKGQKITWWSVSSCSKSVDVISGFIGSTVQSTLFNIQCSTGKCIAAYTCYPTEDEVILLPGTVFEVVANPFHHSGGLHIIHMKEITDDNSDDEAIHEAAKTEPETHRIDRITVGECINHLEGVGERLRRFAGLSGSRRFHCFSLEHSGLSAYDSSTVLYCEGRPCSKCRLCRDWHFSGDRTTWKWITNCKTWSKTEWDRYFDNRVYERFTKRDDATCLYVDLDILLGLGCHLCLCE